MSQLYKELHTIRLLCEFPDAADLLGCVNATPWREHPASSCRIITALIERARTDEKGPMCRWFIVTFEVWPDGKLPNGTNLLDVFAAADFNDHHWEDES